jgi:hypothetical protein
MTPPKPSLTVRPVLLQWCTQFSISLEEQRRGRDLQILSNGFSSTSSRTQLINEYGSSAQPHESWCQQHEQRASCYAETDARRSLVQVQRISGIPARACTIQAILLAQVAAPKSFKSAKWHSKGAYIVLLQATMLVSYYVHLHAFTLQRFVVGLQRGVQSRRPAASRDRNTVLHRSLGR